MKATHFFATVGIIFLMAACNSAGNKESLDQSGIETVSTESGDQVMSEEPESNPESLTGIISSSAAQVSDNDSARKLIRTAEMKFRAKDVVQTTYRIEALAKQFNGFVLHTNLQSEVINTDIIALSADSSLETTAYTISNTITMRVPNTNLDTALKSIAQYVDFLDYRIIDVRDVAIEILSNRMKLNRNSLTETTNTVEVKDSQKGIKTIRQSQDHPLFRRASADEARLANLSLEDRIRFSTITIEIYQREQSKRYVLPNAKNIDEYKPGFGQQFISSVRFGWNILTAIILFIAKIWGIILLCIIAYLIYKLYTIRSKRKQ